MQTSTSCFWSSVPLFMVHLGGKLGAQGWIGDIDLWDAPDGQKKGKKKPVGRLSGDGVYEFQKRIPGYLV